MAEIKRKENEAEALAREHEKLNKKVLNNERQMGELTAELRIIKSKKLLSDREDLQSLLTVIMLNRVINGIAGELAPYMGNSQNDEKEKGD